MDKTNIIKNSSQILVETNSKLNFKDKFEHVLIRVGYNRNKHIIKPGIYFVGKPDASSKIFVTGNYTLSFNLLRESLSGMDAYILVIDTKGVNVWCAAGKGTFGTRELINRIEVTGLSGIVKRKSLILPQLGAPGVSAHEVSKKTGFRIKYGPVRVNDIPEYVLQMKATDKMRKVSFRMYDRLKLIPVEIVISLIPVAILGLIFFLLGGWLMTFSFLAAAFAGIILFPVLLPYIPSSNFSTKGFLLGLIVTIPFLFLGMKSGSDYYLWQKITSILSFLLIMPALTAFVSLNFTGTSTFTSRSGVKREILSYFPYMVWFAASGMILSIFLTIYNLIV